MQNVDQYFLEIKKIDEKLNEIDGQINELTKKRSELARKKRCLERRVDVCLQSSSGNENYDEWMRDDFEWSKKVQQVLNSNFSIEKFRSVQLAGINAAMSGRDCIVVMPTGGGKSLCFQLPAVVSKGFTLVVSPLVSLMEDQLMRLSSLNIEAASLNASSTKEEIASIMLKMVDVKSDLKLLYVTPEKIAKSKRFMNKLEKSNELGLLSRVAIDEVHCCSHWGHDFRPDYKFLSVLKRQFPKVPILGLTATATSDVIEDVTKMLSIPGALVFKSSLNRPNLFYEVYKKPSCNQELLKKIHCLVTTKFKGQSGIIYCLTQKDAHDLTAELVQKGVRAGCYHASMDAEARSKIHREWTKNKLQVVVATVAFGMGIDKPDVRFVIHHSVSKSMENYYQESGRAGRDDRKSSCILFAGFSDYFRQSTMVFTEKTGLEKLYGMISYATNHNQCRRSLIAYHFGDGWEDKDCKKMCDHCSGEFKAVKKNVVEHLIEFLAILKKSEELKQKLTALKLLDVWLGKGNANLRIGDKKQKRNDHAKSREEGEMMLIHFLLEGHLKESFHFTPYSTISYIVTGDRTENFTVESNIEMIFRTSNVESNGARDADVVVLGDDESPPVKKKKISQQN